LGVPVSELEGTAKKVAPRAEARLGLAAVYLNPALSMNCEPPKDVQTTQGSEYTPSLSVPPNVALSGDGDIWKRCSRERGESSQGAHRCAGTDTSINGIPIGGHRP
jgi:hypothetical protein